MEIKVNYLDNLRLEALFDDFNVIADQPIRYKGDGSAPGPFDYFLASSVSMWLIINSLRSQSFCSKKSRDQLCFGSVARNVSTKFTECCYLHRKLILTVVLALDK